MNRRIVSVYQRLMWGVSDCTLPVFAKFVRTTEIEYCLLLMTAFGLF